MFEWFETFLKMKYNERKIYSGNILLFYISINICHPYTFVFKIPSFIHLNKWDRQALWRVNKKFPTRLVHCLGACVFCLLSSHYSLSHFMRFQFIFLDCSVYPKSAASQTYRHSSCATNAWVDCVHTPSLTKAWRVIC